MYHMFFLELHLQRMAANRAATAMSTTKGERQEWADTEMECVAAI